jgi:hypothetical protein
MDTRWVYLLTELGPRLTGILGFDQKNDLVQTGKILTTLKATVSWIAKQVEYF